MTLRWRDWSCREPTTGTTMGALPKERGGCAGA